MPPVLSNIYYITRHCDVYIDLFPKLTFNIILIKRPRKCLNPVFVLQVFVLGHLDVPEQSSFFQTYLEKQREATTENLTGKTAIRDLDR